MEELYRLLPCPPLWQIPWERSLEVLGPLKQDMENTPQNPRWHGEGDVLAHTRFVCQELAKMDAFRSADRKTQLMLYLAALFHDVGKTKVTILEDGQWTSRGHTRVSAEMTRRILWQDLGLCGTKEKQNLRETVCMLIRRHSVPPYAVENEDGRLRLIRFAANGALTDFSIRLLCDLSEADARGRICEDQEDMLERIALCRELAKEANCYEKPYPFPTEHTAYAYCARKNISPDYPLFDDTWGQVILLSGLPGTGKDTWIRENCPSLPVVSLDAIRKAYRISPEDPQDQVAQIAREQARELLRQKKSFVWNATNITSQTRRKLIELFRDYGAAVKIVFLETDWEEQLRRNAQRRDAVPEHAICAMLEKLTPPERYEAHSVQWICI